MAVDPPMRASDNDRDRIVGILRDQVAEGRLTFEEFEERIGRAYTATTWVELRNITRDLPVHVAFAGEGAGGGHGNGLRNRARDLGLHKRREALLLPVLIGGLVAVSLMVARGMSPFVLIALVWIAAGICEKPRRGYACGTRARVTPPRGR